MALRSGRVGIHPSQVDPITGMLLSGTGGASIDDTSIASDTTWSSSKINTELSGKQDELTAGSNISIQNNVISSTASGGVLPLIKITATSGETVTLTKGQTVITATEVTSGNYEAEVPDFGTYVVSDGTNSDSVVVDTVKIYEVDITPGPSTISVTLTVYSAKEDQLTIVDEDGTHLEQFASGQSSKSITVKIAAEGSDVSFTSSIAKDPSDLTEYYTKTVTVTSATTDIYVMPDNALYWWGWKHSNLGNVIYGANVSAALTEETNFLGVTVYCSVYQCGGYIIPFTNAFDCTEKTKFKTVFSVPTNTTTYSYVGVGLYNALPTSQIAPNIYSGTERLGTNSTEAIKTYSVDISTSGDKYFGLTSGGFNEQHGKYVLGQPNTRETIHFNAIWLE